MNRVPKAVYTVEFKAEAVKRVLEQKLSLAEAAKRLSIPNQTLSTWVTHARQGSLERGVLAVTEQASELSRLRKALARAEMERDILKKATAYFAKESLPGTRS